MTDENKSSEMPQDTDSSVIQENKPLDATEMYIEAAAIEASLNALPEFSEKIKEELDRAKKIIEGIRRSEITEEEAIKIIAVGRAELAMETETDLLTDLPNRRAIERIIKEQVTLAKRNGTNITIAFVDLDRFKDINDRYSHDAGDVVLQGLGGFLKSTLKRPTDKAGRWGGEEFILVLPDTNAGGANKLLNDLRQEMNDSVSEAAFQAGGFKFDRDITASIGFESITAHKDDTRTPENIASELIMIADRRCLLAKKNGRNCVVGPQQEKGLIS